jgi:hypothetical protein
VEFTKPNQDDIPTSGETGRPSQDDIRTSGHVDKRVWNIIRRFEKG